MNTGTPDPGSGLFLDDIDGETRPSMMNAWDIGPDEYNYPSDINFTDPTPRNNSLTGSNWVYVNVSVNDTDDYSAFIDWNRSLVGWWSFDSRFNSTLVFDNSTWENNGTVYGATVTSSGKRGDAYEFDGDGDLIESPDSGSLKVIANFTISVWVKKSEDRSWQEVFAKDCIHLNDCAGYGLRADDSGNMIFVLAESSTRYSATSSSSLNVGEWYYIVGRYNGTAGGQY